MIQVTFIQPDGDRQVCRSQRGDTLLDVALDHGIAGIKGQCGGGCTCCTCHCYVRQPGYALTTPPHQDELDMLEYAWGRAPDSRLACQVQLSEALLELERGLEVEVPIRQS